MTLVSTIRSWFSSEDTSIKQDRTLKHIQDMVNTLEHAGRYGPSGWHIHAMYNPHNQEGDLTIKQLMILKWGMLRQWLGYYF